MENLIQENIELSPLERLAVDGIISKDGEDVLSRVGASMGHSGHRIKKHLVRIHPDKVYEATKDIAESNPNVAKAIVNYILEPIIWSKVGHKKVEEQNPDVDYNTYHNAIGIPASQRIFFATNLALRIGTEPEKIVDYLTELMRRGIEEEKHYSRIGSFIAYILPIREELKNIDNGAFYGKLIQILPHLITPETLEGLPEELKEFGFGWHPLRYNSLLQLNESLNQINSRSYGTEEYSRKAKELRKNYCGDGWLEPFIKKRQESMNELIDDIRIVMEDLEAAMNNESFATNYGAGKEAIERFATEYNDLVNTLLPKVKEFHDTYRGRIPAEPEPQKPWYKRLLRRN